MSGKKGKDVPNNYQMLKTSWSVQGKLFFEHSTLHGVRYIAENGRPFIERFMWFACVAVGTIATTVIIFNLWEKFQTNPTITGLDTDFHNWDVSFPGITVCQVIPTSNEKIEEYIQEHYQRNGSSAELDFFTDLSRLSLYSFPYFTEKYLSQTYIDSKTNLKELIFNLTYRCEEVFDSCFWKSYPYNCCDGFFPVFTENGFCYTFNSRHYEKRIPGKENGKGLPEFSRQYIQETDIKWSLKFKVKSMDSHLAYAPGGSSELAYFHKSISGKSLFPTFYYGNEDYDKRIRFILRELRLTIVGSYLLYLIYILDSDEVAGIDTQPQHMWDFRMETIKFSVKQTYTTEDTAQLSIKQRQCAFPNEIKLMGEEIYSYTACTRECRMKNAMKLCSCVPFFFPIGTTGYVHCKIDELACISKHLEEIKSVDSCSCYLGCSNTVYEVEKLDNFGSNQDAEEGTLDCMFVSWPMVRYKREVLFGWVDLLVSFGGIAGLFLGFSLLSGVEILYYFTIRTCCMVVKEKKQLKNIRLQEKLGTSPKYHSNPPPYFISKTPTFDDTGITLQSGLFSKVSKRVGPFNDQRQSQPQPTIIKSPFGIEFIN